jgi:AcrR family transcriptional regulator
MQPQSRRRAYQPVSGRARPLPPEQRRAMLIEATLPLLAQHGPKVTTKQIAQAAGVAEGTIFRVFADKNELVDAAIQHAIDPELALADLAAVDLTLPLYERMVQITAISQRRLITVFSIMIAMRMTGPPKGRQPVPPQGPPPSAKPGSDKILAEVVRLLEPDRDQFRRPVEDVARVLRLLVFSGSHPLITDGILLTAEEIASTVLDGVRRRPDPSDRGDSRC